ncbi:centrosomal protein of 164 kDa-like isoform X2 [Tachysurus vachellii]|uniref:centrosomal protein of 164 kDa-like isoform X2 n=1 Tax=Tachysurus vachellii TaxID=175792 RepID=UPI00296AAEB0|nr:centrosomal protein of 164 kDa-like isoform X2 [Tachysurus vachellii]
MSASALKIGDQLILEEDYDENYIPSEQEIHEYAREIGIDPEREPELLWLAREGIVAPLPAEWKPCQDVTGDVYYFNFTTGQSTWDHPCDEQYRRLVTQERERSSGSAHVRNDKEKKKKKEKKEKKKERKKSEPEGPKASGPLGPLAPLRSVCDTAVPALRGSLGSSSGPQLKTPLGGSRMNSGLHRGRQEERPSLAPPKRYSDDEEDEEEVQKKISIPPSLCGTSRLLQNLHLDLDALGGGLQYEDSEVSRTAPAEEKTEPELQDLALSGEISGNPPSPSQDSLRGRRLSPKQLGGSRDCSSADVFPPSRQGESFAEDELIPLEMESEERTGSEEEEVEEERQSERDEEMIKQLDRETKSDVEIPKARDGLEESETPNSDEIMEKYVDQVYSGEEEEQSERDEEQMGEEGENNCAILNETVEEKEEMELSNRVRQEKATAERRRSSSEEKRDEADAGRSEGEEKTSVKHTEEDEGNYNDSKATKMSESEDEEIERIERTKENTDKLLQQTGMLGKKRLPRSDRLPSEESEISEHVEVVSSHSVGMKVRFRSNFSENVLDLSDLCLADPKAAPEEKEKYDRREAYEDDYEKEEEEIRGEATKSGHRKSSGLDKWLPDHTQETPSSSSVSKHEDVEGERRMRVDKEEKERKHETKDRTKKGQEESKEVKDRRRHDEELRTRREEEEKETQRQVEEERLRAVEERDKKLQLLRDQMRREEEEEERRIREENEKRIRALKERLQREREEEEERLDQETRTKLQQLREHALRDRDTHLHKLREENEKRASEVRAELEAERERLEAQRRRELEKMTEESEEELKAEKRRLQEKWEEQLSSLRAEETTSNRKQDLRSPQPQQQLLDYKRELSEVLQEVRDEVQREHSRKLEQLKEEHRNQLQTMREMHLEEESNERERVTRALEEERAQLLTSHTAQVEQLRLQLDTQLYNVRRTHTQKEAEVQGLIEKLELKTKELKIQDSRLLAQAADLEKRRKQLDKDERGLETLPHLLEERERLLVDLERARQASDREREERMREREEMERERKREWEENRNMKDERERLQIKVTLLQEKCDQLTRRVRELEQRESADCKEEEKKEQEDVRRNRESEESLRVEDLEPSPSHGTHSNIEELRDFISSENVSLQRARQFLDRHNGNLRDRQTMLKVARTTLQDPSPGGVAHLLPENIQQEASRLEELKQTVQKGHKLLRKKEERLSQLENSLVEELSCDDAERTEAERRVTFDVTDSEASSVYSQDGAVPVKVQHLADSLQQISSQLNMVLGALGSLAPKTSSSTSTSLPRTSSFPPASSWAWPSNTASSSGAKQNGFTHSSMNGVTALRGSDLLLNSSWRNLLPGVSMDTTFSTRAHTAHSGYMPTSLSSMMQSKSSELDSLRLRGLIEGNKRWLETRRKDTNVPLFTRYQVPPSSNGLVQLSLDENNQIRVHHY